MLKTNLRLLSMFALLAAAACGGGDDDDDDAPVADAAPPADANPAGTTLEAMTVCGSLHPGMCESATEICRLSSGGSGRCVEVPAGCDSAVDEERTCAECAAACEDLACGESTDPNTVTCS